jgi:DNA-binding beta-propeller fold protein YncE
LVALALTLTAAPALAFRGHAFTGVSFGGSGSGNGQLDEPTDVAVNEATGDVYVTDKGNNRVEVFDASGSYVGQFNGSGTLPGEGKAAGSGPGEIATGEFEGPTQIAVDNSCKLHNLSGAACKVFDPSNEDVYVLDEGHFVVDKYTRTGEYVGQITGSPRGGRFETQLFGVAVSPSGAVAISGLEEGSIVAPRVYFYGNEVLNGFVHETNPSIAEFFREGLALDAAENIYVHIAEGDVIEEIEPIFGLQLNPALDREESSGVAVEQTNSNVYVDNISSVARFTSDGNLVERFEAPGMEGNGVAVNSASDNIYVPDVKTNVVDVFPLAPPGSPTVESDSLLDVTSDSVTLGAEINPRGAATEYRFEYGACATTTTCPSTYEGSVPLPDGVVGSDFEIHSVSAQLQGLREHSAYHFRVVAHNPIGGESVALGEDRAFVTQSAGGGPVLPDGREWEMVSPPSKQGALIEPLSEGVVQASADGGELAYLANVPVEAEPQGFANEAQILSTRGPDGWASKNIGVAVGKATGKTVGAGQEYRFFSEDLSLGVVQPLGHGFVPLSGEATEQTAYLRDAADGSFQPLVSAANVPSGVEFGEKSNCFICGPQFVGGTPDLSHIILESNVALTEGAATPGLYEWSANHLTFIGKPTPSESAKLEFRAISTDGSLVIFEGELEGHKGLLVYDATTAETALVETEHAAPQTGIFSGASSDGSHIFFASTDQLTSGSGAGIAGTRTRDLYECEVTRRSGKLECVLSDLTPLGAGEEHADVLGVLGTSEDGSWVYFAANGALTPGAVQGACKATGSVAECDVYAVHREGGVWQAPHLVAVVSNQDMRDWAKGLNEHTARVSGNGEWLAFMSQRSLTGYDNRDAVSGESDEEVFLYHAAGSGELTCASCNPTGARPAGVEYTQIDDGSAGGVEVWGLNTGIAANIPGWTPNSLGVALYQSRYLSDSGRLFFNSSDALVPRDVNGTEDVYEYEPPGIGYCTRETPGYGTASGGCVGLISSGNSAQESGFLDASTNGNDVFFLTSAKLAPQDYDKMVDVYDAHECGAPAPCTPQPAASPPPCDTEASCRVAPTPQPAIFGAPASATFNGAGNQPASSSVAVKTKIKPLTRAQKLARALRRCRTESRHKRPACMRAAKHEYGQAATKTRHSQDLGGRR